MRVTFVTSSALYAGAEESLAVLLGNLDRNIDCHIVGRDEGVVDKLRQAHAGATASIAPAVVDKRGLIGARKLMRELSAARPDVVHLNKSDVGDLRYLHALLALGRRVPVVSVVHHVEPPGSMVSHRLARALARRAGTTVAVSHGGASTLSQMLDLDPTLVETIHNAVERRDVGPTRRPGPFVVGTLCRFVAHKGVHTLMQAVAQTPHVRLLIGGDGPERDVLLQLSEDLDVADRVEFLGWVEPDDVLQHITVFALASTIEGHPMTLLHAQRQGLPIIASAVGGIPEIVTDGVDGLLVEPGSVAELTAAILRLRDDPSLVHKMGARARTSGILDPHDMARAYEKVYEAAIGNARSRPPNRLTRRRR